MARANIAQSHPQDWTYLSEGASTIVFSYAGPFHTSFTSKVLRLRKVSLSKASHCKPAIEEEDDPVIAFQNTVMATLVPSNLLPELDVVLLHSEWLAALELLRNCDRPPERRAAGQIDKARQKGILATNVVGGAEVLAIEIKPKWGFLPNSAHLSRETVRIKTSTCRFCMHTRFKFKDSLPTQYCPLDFFSTDEARQKMAIRDLWNGWVQSDGALNNMKIFVSGKMIRPSELHSLQEFLSVRTQDSEALVTALLPYLQSPALKMLSDLQRSLDPLDIEGIVKLYAMAHPDAKGLEAVVQNPSIEQLQEFVASYHSVYCAWDHSRVCPENIDTYLIAFLLSATFKDCSLIFRIRQSDMAGNTLSTSPDTITVIDLDIKGVSRLEKWVQLDRDIVKYYRHIVRPKSCVE